MLLRGAFTVLSLLSGVSSVLVLPPTNVTVSCQNVNTTVSWDYNKQQPHTRFKVTIGSDDSQTDVNCTTDCLYELSKFVWQSQERYMSFLYVTVTAIQGDNQSEAVKSNSFSFNDLKTVDTKCFLDFPPVKWDGTKTSLVFQNPLSFYKELNSTVEGTSPVFSFDVSSDGHNFNGGCSVKDSLCKLDVMFSEDEEKCVALKGRLFYNNGINVISFRGTDRFCSPDEPDHGEIVLPVILMSVFVLLICVLAILICKMKAWTMKIPDVPKFLVVQTDQANVHHTDKAAISPISIFKPYKKSLIKTKHKSYPESYHGSSSGSNTIPSERNLYMDKGGQLEDDDQEPEALGLVSGGNGTDKDSADDSVQIESVSVSSQDEEQESVSPYDSPHLVMLDMGDGDMVTGYSGREDL